LVPFQNTDYFDFAYGDESADERIVDAQMASTNLYPGTTMMGDKTMVSIISKITVDLALMFVLEKLWVSWNFRQTQKTIT